MKINLMLITIKPFTSRTSGEEKFKYIFLSEKGVVYDGFADYKAYEDLLSDDEDFNAARAREWEVTRDTFNGKLVQRVSMPPTALDTL